MIDFEKSKTLGMNPTIQAASLEPRRLWPTGQLGMLLRGIVPERPPRKYLDSIRSVGADVVRGIVLSTAVDVPIVSWGDAAVDVLLGRAQRIQPLVEEIWQRN
jgi:hypothetical protein